MLTYVTYQFILPFMCATKNTNAVVAKRLGYFQSLPAYGGQNRAIRPQVNIPHF